MNSVVPLLARVTASAAASTPCPPLAAPTTVLVLAASDQAPAAMAAFGPTAIAALPGDIATAERLAEVCGVRTLRLDANCGGGEAAFSACAARPPAILCGTPSERPLHSPARRARDEAFYRTMVSGDLGAPCLDALSAGYRRNFAICANLVDRTRPGERVILLAASRDLSLLRQCLAETPGLRPVGPGDYRPR
ncbi:MAG: hypothetical protein AB1942_01720 [Pseudomonadota bacterium]